MKNKEENFHGKENQHYYLGNKNLPRSTAEFEWTPKMVHDLKKCKKNILHTKAYLKVIILLIIFLCKIVCLKFSADINKAFISYCH